MKICFELLVIKKDKWIGHYAEDNFEYHEIGEKQTVYGRWHYLLLLPMLAIKWYERKE